MSTVRIATVKEEIKHCCRRHYFRRCRLATLQVSDTVEMYRGSSSVSLVGIVDGLSFKVEGSCLAGDSKCATNALKSDPGFLGGVEVHGSVSDPEKRGHL